ncbi:hypothetical protein HZA56_19745 [Candidatus Poribacteria bacterium]|nr:hypothetical protein [Candidatus Poribacteria bacterium]
MEAKLSRKLVVSIAGVVAGLAALAVVYVMYLRPYVKVWLKARSEINERKEKLAELRKNFGDQANPQSELRTLQQEINVLVDANKALKKVKTPGTETSALPKELEDPDKEIRRELYRDYLKQVMDLAEDGMKEKLKTANIPPPDFELYTELDNAEEAAYYMNRAAGLKGLIEAIIKSRSSGSAVTLDYLTLENYEEGKKRREGAVNVINYALKMSMDTQSLVSFLYNLQAQDSFYYVEEMQLQPRGAGRGSGGAQLDITARINTTMVFQSQVNSQVQAAAAAITGGKGGGGGGLMSLFAAATQEVAAEQRRRSEKKWYQFWKRSKKETTEGEQKK